MLFPGNLFDDFSVGIVLEQHFVLLRFIRLKKARISHLPFRRSQHFWFGRYCRKKKLTLRYWKCGLLTAQARQRKITPSCHTQAGLANITCICTEIPEQSVLKRKGRLMMCEKSPELKDKYRFRACGYQWTAPVFFHPEGGRKL